MGEYANYKGRSIKIGTCESMYYLTLGDRNKVDYKFNYKELYVWRLPEIGDYKEPGDGEYEDWSDTCKTMIDDQRFWELLGKQFSEKELDNMKRTIQISHKCGYLVNIPCFHGRKLPNTEDSELQVFWNGKDGHFLRMSGIVTRGDEVGVLVSCRHCSFSVTLELEELKYVLMNDKGDWLFGDEGRKYYEKIMSEISEYRREV